MARCGVSPVVLMPYFRSFGSRSRKTCETSTMSFRVVGSPPESMRHLDVLPERRREDAVDLLERHVGLAVAALPVAAHLAARVADERAVEDQDGRVDRLEARDVGVDEVARRADRRLQRGTSPRRFVP